MMTGYFRYCQTVSYKGGGSMIVSYNELFSAIEKAFRGSSVYVVKRYHSRYGSGSADAWS